MKINFQLSEHLLSRKRSRETREFSVLNNKAKYLVLIPRLVLLAEWIGLMTIDNEKGQGTRKVGSKSSLDSGCIFNEIQRGMNLLPPPRRVFLMWENQRRGVPSSVGPAAIQQVAC